MSDPLWEVEWLEDAEVELGRLLYTSADQRDIVRAMNAIEADLSKNPHDVGESRGEETRIVIERPIAVYCRLIPERLLVVIYAAWRWNG